MNIEYISPKDLKQYYRNAKKHDETQIKNVMESIKQFGFVQPIVIDEDNEIIIGHCRHLAALKANLETVPCVRMSDLSDEEVEKLRLLDNKLNESEWDFELLIEDIPQLDFSGFDIDWGLEEVEELEPTEVIEDEPPEEIETRVKLGDLWQLGRWVYCKKCGKKHYIS